MNCKYDQSNGHNVEFTIEALQHHQASKLSRTFSPPICSCSWEFYTCYTTTVSFVFSFGSVEFFPL